MGLRAVTALICLVLASVSHSVDGRPTSSHTWTASWGTAQPIGPATRRPPSPAATTRSTPVPPPPPSPMVPYPATLSDQTVRMIVRTSAGGEQLRVEFSNAAGGPTVVLGKVRAALVAGGAAIKPASDRAVTFAGRPSLTLIPGAKAVSDPVDLRVPPLAEVAISIYLPGQTPTNTVHALGLNPAYIVSGDATSAARLPAPQLVRSYFWLTGLSVPSQRPDGGTIVAFGDSITDGYATTPGAFTDWPSLLAARLQRDPRTAGWSVVNAGISGNRVLKAGAGEAAVARFDNDVLARPNVRWVILLEGINDINMSIIPTMPATEQVTAEQIIQGLSQLADRAHERRIKVAGATILPTKGLPFYSARGEDMRRAVNAWIRTSGKFDAVIDFDSVVRDPNDPLKLRTNFDPGDHVHPNDAGNIAMANAIDLSIFW